MAEYLHFYFSINDPKFKSYSVVVNDCPKNYIAHAFISTPRYDVFDVEVGYKCSDDYIQQVAEDKYMVRISNTYYFKNKGTISWQYAFINDKPSYYYPLGVVASSNITATTGDYFGKTVDVSLTPKEDGRRDVTIGFNFN
jgi:hypothetical protein